MMSPIADHPELTLVVTQGHIHEDVLGDTVLVEILEHLEWTLPVILLSALAIAV
jgi:hypothetical protein